MKQCLVAVSMLLLLLEPAIDLSGARMPTSRTAPSTHYSGAPQTVDPTATTVETRFLPLPGCRRMTVAPNSFAHYLRNLKLKAHGSVVHYFNGQEKPGKVYDAVVDIDIGDKDLQQCADAIIRLRAEYFYAQHQLDSISFALTNGFVVDFSRWAKGYRVRIKGNKAEWVHSAKESTSYAIFREYLEFVFRYAGTLSLAKSMHSKSIENIDIGDVFVKGGSPGHAVIVVDMCTDAGGQKYFLLAQSYMPAQDIQILKNPSQPGISPWYSIPPLNHISTPEWVFSLDQLKRW